MNFKKTLGSVVDPPSKQRKSDQRHSEIEHGSPYVFLMRGSKQSKVIQAFPGIGYIVIWERDGAFEIEAEVEDLMWIQQGFPFILQMLENGRLCQGNKPLFVLQ
jgi:hypothetical protein